jgi:hypothetical protein
MAPAPTDSTYGSLTVGWDVVDPDAGGPGLHYRVWLDGDSAAYETTPERTYTVPTAKFLQVPPGGGAPTFLSGPRTLFVQAVDDGGSEGPPSAVTWYVRAPAQTLSADLKGEVLIVDASDKSSTTNAAFDAFYPSVVTSGVTASRISILRPEFNPRIFRNGRDFAQTLRQFRAVVWYHGQDTSIDSLLLQHHDSLAAYVDGGGNLYLDGLYLIEGLNVPGALPESFIYDRFPIRRTALSVPPVDSTAGWANQASGVFRSSVYDTVLRAAGIAETPRDRQGGIRAYVVDDTSVVALWAKEGQLSPPNVGFEGAVGLARTLPGGGRLVIINYPIRLATPATATRLMSRILFGYGAVPGVIRPGPVQRSLRF